MSDACPSTVAAPSSTVAASRASLLINPTSFSASRDGLAQRVRTAARELGLGVTDIQTPQQQARAVAQALEARCGLLVVCAGDGTVRGVAEQLAELPPFARRPTLLILPGGRSNLIAADFHRGASCEVLLRRAMQAWRSGDTDAIQTRRSLRLEQDGQVRHGFFIGAALVDSVIRSLHRYRQGQQGWRAGGLGTAWHAGAQLLRALRGGMDDQLPDLSVEATGLGRLDGPIRILLATTLLHAQGGPNPYAVPGTDGLRLTAVHGRTTSFAGRLPKLLAGRFDAAMSPANGWLSGPCDHAVVSGLRHAMLDGEPFDCDPSRPLILGAGPHLRFLAA